MSSIADTDVHLPLLRAYPHQWGPGKVHQVDCEQTLCGKHLRFCPGEKFKGFHDEITCEVCLRSRESRIKHAEWEKNYARQQGRSTAGTAGHSKRSRMNYGERQAINWQSDYREYLLSPIWLGKRARVLLRANDMCEGCGCRRAYGLRFIIYAIQGIAGLDPMIGSGKGKIRSMLESLSVVSAMRTCIKGG